METQNTYPISYRGHYYQRSGATNQELRGAALDRFILRSQGRTWDGVPVPFVKAEDLDNSTFDYFRKRAERSGRMDEMDLQENNAALLDKLRLVEGDYLKRATVLLFHPDPERFVTGAYIKIGYFKEEANLIFQDEIHGNLFQQVKSAMDLITTKYMRALISYEGIQRVETLPVPKEALREALLNAVVHKAYESLTPIQIAVYDDKMEICNCGILPDDWTIANLLAPHRSRPYNPDIANAFFRAGEIEAWGRGIQRIIGACVKAGCPEPKFKTVGGEMWTVFEFKFNNDETKDVTKELQDNERKDERKELTERQRLIINILQENPSIAQHEMSEKTGIPYISIRREMAYLCKGGYLVRVNGRKQGHWEVNIPVNE